ncbi:MAG: hypothetical protein ABIO72_02440 [Patescibacteria group bacterium]
MRPVTYLYCRAGPVTLSDPSGLDERVSVDPNAHRITYSTSIDVYTNGADPDRVRQLARGAENFYANRTNTAAEDVFGPTVGGFLEDVLAPNPTPRAYTDPETGIEWAVVFDVKYNVIEGSSPIPPFAPKDKEGFINIPPGLFTLLADAGLETGENIISYLPESDPGFEGGVGGRTFSITGNIPATDIRYPQKEKGTAEVSLVHESGHLLGFDERYGLETDMMRAAQKPDLQPLKMGQEHVDNAAQFALGLAGELSSVGRLSNFELFGVSLETRSTDAGPFEKFVHRKEQIERQLDLRIPTRRSESFWSSYWRSP